MKNAFLILSFLINLVLLGQEPKQQSILDIITPELNKLQKDKIDSLVYFIPCNGRKFTLVISGASKEEIRTKQCENTDIAYVIWQQNGKTNITKFNKCWRYKTITIDTLDFIRQFAKNYKSIYQFQPKPFEFISDSKDTLMTIVSHSCHWDIFIKIREMEYKKNIDHYGLLQKSYDGDVNINYEYNNNLSLIKLLQMLDKQLSSIQFEKE